MNADQVFQMTPANFVDRDGWPEWLHLAWEHDRVYTEPGDVPGGTRQLIVVTEHGPVPCEWGGWIRQGDDGQLSVRDTHGRVTPSPNHGRGRARSIGGPRFYLHRV